MSKFGVAHKINISDPLKIELHAVCVKVERHIGLQLLRNWVDEILRSFDMESTDSFCKKSSSEYEREDIRKYTQNNFNENTNQSNGYLQCTESDSAIIVPNDTDALDSVYTDEIVLQYGDDIVTQEVFSNSLHEDQVIDLQNLQRVDYCASRFINMVDQTNSFDDRSKRFNDPNDIGATLEVTQDNSILGATLVTLNCGPDVDEPLEYIEYNHDQSVGIDNCVVELVIKSNSCFVENTKVELVSDNNFEAAADEDVYSSTSITSDELITMNRLCNICFKTCSSKSNLMTHMKTHSKERPFVCKVCGKDFRILHNLHLHQRTHTGERHHVCTKCGRAFAWPESLKRHQSTHSNERPYSCAHCDKNFSHNQHLIRHLRVAHIKDEGKFTCSQCGKNCSSTYDLKVHEAWCRGERPHVCSYCDKTFAAARNLKQHQRVHTGERPYACTICDKRFQLSSYVKVHIRQVHSDERPYKCVKCDMSFAVKRVLTRHLLVHSGERPFGCTYCDKKLSSAFALKAHEEKHLRNLCIGQNNVTCSKKINIDGGFDQDALL